MRNILLTLSVLVLIIAFALPNDAYATVNGAGPAAEDSLSEASADRVAQAQRRKKKRRKKKRRRKRGKKKVEEEPAATETKKAEEKAPEVLDLSAPPPDAPAPPPVLDLSTVDDSESAKEELLQDPETSTEAQDEGFDFGEAIDLGDLGSEGESGEISFDELELDTATMGGDTPEKARFDAAMELMSDEEFDGASMEFRYFLEDEKFAEFKDESQYQLAKALYKLGFLDASLKRFEEILNAGPAHGRFRKSIEWLFFISRKMADEMPVLAQLAKFRNVKFPKAYRNEFNFLMAKYLFLQANQFALDRQNAEQLAALKKGTEGFDFTGLEQAVSSGDGFDFGGGGGGEASGGGGFDFGGGGSSEGD
ncbi:MAG: hypothetical protein AAFY60_00600, partial [Myxococcota bacterium]